MKQIIICISFLGVVTLAHSQPLPDNVKAKYNAAKTDEEKGRLLYAYFIRPSAADSNAITHAVELLTWFKKQQDEVGANYIELYLAAVFSFKGDYSTSLSMALPILSRFEKRKDGYGLMNANHDIGLAYSMAKDYNQSVDYYKKSIALAELLDPKGYLSKACNDIGVSYYVAAMPDSGLLYAQRAVKIDTENKDTARLATSLSTLGENYMAAGEYEIALPFLRKSFAYLLQATGGKNSYSLTYAYNDFAQAFFALKQLDSAYFYAYRAINVSLTSGYKDQLLRAYEYLYKSFDETGKHDSVSKYFRLAMTAKDSLYSMEKTRSTEALNFREKMRQQEAETEKLKAEEERKQNIQFAFIAFGIIAFIIVFLLLSRSIITNTKIIEFLGVVALLIVFEFLNLLLHPFLERVTHHSPGLMLLALVCIAALLVPLHHKAEKWATAKLVEKNKAIRLAAAKKTIETLEGNKIENI